MAKDVGTDAIDRLDHLGPEIEMIVMFARIGKKFYDIAYKYMESTCDEAKKEATAYPFWMVEDASGAGYACPFFSREEADSYRLTLRYPDWYKVRCYSGKYSKGFEAILDLAASIIGGDPS